MTLVRSNSFAQMQETMNRMIDRQMGFRRQEDAPVQAAWSPAVDVCERGGDFVLTAELPGVPLEEINISLDNNVLSISGELHNAKDVEEGSYHWRERASGSFRRTFNLPATADRNKISASYKNGVLTVAVPQNPEAKPKQIAVKAA